jgi:acyl dehydratase
MSAYEQIVVGEVHQYGSHTFAAEEIMRFAAAYDPQIFHADEAAASASHFGGLIASGWHTASAMMRLFVDHFSREGERAAARGEVSPRFGPSPGFDDLQWLRPVHAGDTVAFAGKILAKRESRSRPGWGIVTIEITGANQRAEKVFALTAHVFAVRANPD